MIHRLVHYLPCAALFWNIRIVQSSGIPRLRQPHFRTRRPVVRPAARATPLQCEAAHVAILARTRPAQGMTPVSDE